MLASIPAPPMAALADIRHYLSGSQEAPVFENERLGAGRGLAHLERRPGPVLGHDTDQLPGDDSATAAVLADDLGRRREREGVEAGEPRHGGIGELVRDPG